MFSLSEDFVRAQHDYTRERLGTGVRHKVDEERPGRHRSSLFTRLFARSRLRPSLHDC
jgi:hypothetical protein